MPRRRVKQPPEQIGPCLRDTAESAYSTGTAALGCQFCPLWSCLFRGMHAPRLARGSRSPAIVPDCDRASPANIRAPAGSADGPLADLGETPPVPGAAAPARVAAFTGRFVGVFVRTGASLRLQLASLDLVTLPHFKFRSNFNKVRRRRR